VATTSGFFNILDARVLRVEQAFAGDCDAAVKSAYDKVNGFDLFNDVVSALHQIIDKSGRADFRVFQTGYPAFFNVDTSTCDLTTFYYWQPAHHSFRHIGNWAYLRRDLDETAVVQGDLILLCGTDTKDCNLGILVARQRQCVILVFQENCAIFNHRLS